MKMITLMLFSVFMITGCPFENDDTEAVEEAETASFCPSISDDVTWYSYGTFEMKNVGSDYTARRIISECGWHIYREHNGGYGDTLQIASPNEEVIFVWAYNTFYGFVLNEGWTGATHKGAMMGDHSSDFYGLHHEVRYRNQGLGKYDDKNTSVDAYFDINDFLEKIYVGYYFRN